MLRNGCIPTADQIRISISCSAKLRAIHVAARDLMMMPVYRVSLASLHRLFPSLSQRRRFCAHYLGGSKGKAGEYHENMRRHGFIWYRMICLWIPRCEYRSIFVLGHFGLDVSPIRETLWTTFSRRWFFSRFSRSFLDYFRSFPEKKRVNQCQPQSDEFSPSLNRLNCLIMHLAPRLASLSWSLSW